MPAGDEIQEPKVVIDTNVFVSGLNFPGRPREVLDLMRKGEIGVVVSPFILGELEKGLADDFGWSRERLERVYTTDQRYEIPEDFDPYHYLSTAWGIMGGDPVVEVQLCFSPQVTWRVKESVWHPSQIIEDLPDGGCVLTMRVNRTLEMKPWIRG